MRPSNTSDRAAPRPPCAPPAGSARPDPASGLVRLIGFVLSGPVEMEAEGSALALRRGALVRRAPAALVTHCLQRGLLAREGNRLTALPPARPLLKRLLSGGDTGFLAQHADLATEERLIGDGRRTVTVNRQDSVLGHLAQMKDRSGAPWFSPAAIEAGERLNRDFTFGGLQPRLTARLEPRLSARDSGGRGGQAELSDHQIDARARLQKALSGLGPDLSGVALDVCCFGKGLEQVERERQWPARSAKLMLRTALSQLGRHYGFSPGGAP